MPACIDVSDQGPINDQHIRLRFNQGLTEAEMRDNIQFSPHHLRRRRAQLQLHGQVHFSDPPESCFLLRNYLVI